MLMELVTKILDGARTETLTTAQKLAIREEVGVQLKNLPLDTHLLIEKMVNARVELREKMYRTIFLVVGVAFSVLSVSFYNITANNAAHKVTEMLEKSEAAKKIEDLKTFYREGQEKLYLIHGAEQEATNRINQLTARLRELDAIDNILRYSADGKLRVKSIDGAIWMERRDGTGSKGYIRIVQLEGGLTFELGSD